MIDYEHINLFSEDSVDKQFLIVSDDNSVAITNTELHQGSFELTESISSDNNLVFGTAVASTVKFTASNVFTQLKNKWITVYITLDHDTSNSFKLGRYKVYSDSPTADRKKRTVVAYDALYDILNADVAKWYNSILPSKSSKVTLKKFRDSFFAHFGIEQEEINLINDNMTVEKTIEPDQLSGKVVVNAICEINGCFGHIGRNGQFQYIYLKQSIEGLYPAQDLYPSEDLFPRASDSILIGTGTYIPPCTYEDYKVQSITGLQIRTEENSIGIEVGTAENQYVIDDNFLVYGKGASELREIAQKILQKIIGIVYKPFSTKAKGNPCIEVGDAVRLNTKTQRIESYVLQRVLSGIQALRDSFSSTGNEYLDNKPNSIARSITQLKGRTNELIRTNEETRSTLTNLETSTQTQFRQTAEEISAEATRAINAERNLSGRISLTATDISMKVSNGETTSGITITVKKENGETEEISGVIELTGLVKFTDLSRAGSTTINGSNITTGKINAKYIELPGIEIGSDTVASIHAGQLFTSYFNCSGFAEIGSLAVGSYNVVDELEYLQQQIDELKERLSE